MIPLIASKENCTLQEDARSNRTFVASGTQCIYCAVNQEELYNIIFNTNRILRSKIYKYQTQYVLFIRKLIAQQQKMMEEQRKRMEKAIKEKQFQDQQKRLKEFTAIGGRKVDVDSFMKSIVGDEPKKPQPQCRPGGPVQPGHMASGAAQPAPGKPTTCTKCLMVTVSFKKLL